MLSLCKLDIDTQIQKKQTESKAGWSATERNAETTHVDDLRGELSLYDAASISLHYSNALKVVIATSEMVIKLTLGEL